MVWKHATSSCRNWTQQSPLLRQKQLTHILKNFKILILLKTVKCASAYKRTTSFILLNKRAHHSFSVYWKVTQRGDCMAWFKILIWSKTNCNKREVIDKKFLWNIKQPTGRDKIQNPDITQDVNVKEDKLVELSIKASLWTWQIWDH